MTFDWDTFQTTYLAASQEEKDLIDSNAIANCIEYQIGFKTIDESHQSVVKTLCAFHLLQLVSAEDAVKEMQALGIPNASEIFSTLQNCLKSAQTVPVTLDTPVPIPPPSSLATEIEEAEAAIKAIPKIKTMAQDAQGVPTHTSSQDSLLGGGKST